MRVGLAFVGLGTVGRALLSLLAEEAPALDARYDLQLTPASLCDSSGILPVSSWGDAQRAMEGKARLGSLGAARGSLEPAGPTSVLQSLESDAWEAVCVLDATPSDYGHPEASTQRLTWLLEGGANVITANKAPLATAYRQVMEACISSGASLGFTATTGLTSPAVDELAASTAGSRVLSLEGVVNGTSAHILSEMESTGATFQEALAQAQERGIAEPLPSLDVDGWDSAAKLAILASTMFGMEFTVSDVVRTGIRGVSVEDIEGARAGGASTKLVARARRDAGGGDGRISLTVGPEAVPSCHPLHGLVGSEKGFVLETDLFGPICIRGGRSGIRTTAAVMMRDLILALR